MLLPRYNKRDKSYNNILIFVAMNVKLHSSVVVGICFFLIACSGDKVTPDINSIGLNFYPLEKGLC